MYAIEYMWKGKKVIGKERFGSKPFKEAREIALKLGCTAHIIAVAPHEAATPQATEPPATPAPTARKRRSRAKKG